jgi:hypothetical protein
MNRLRRFVFVCVFLAATCLSAVGTGSTPLAAAPPVVQPINIGTVPLTRGLPITFDGTTRLTDSHGVAHFQPASTSRLSTRVSMRPHQTTRDGVPVLLTAGRLYGDNEHLQLALNSSYRVSFSFVSDSGQQINADQVKSLTVKSATGHVQEIPAEGASWLQGNRMVADATGFQVKELYWTVQNVQIAGANVVHASQQRFMPASEQEVRLNVLFFGVQVHVYDAFFGRSVGDAVQIKYPDGTVNRVALDGDGRVTLPSLPRGNYTITTFGPGPSLSTPIAISRDQVVELKFYSIVDILIFTNALALLALGALWWGKVRRRRPGAAAAEDTPEPAEAGETRGELVEVS